MSKLIVLVGLPGSGKSYWAERAVSPEFIISSDNLRKELLGDERAQTNNSLVFQTMLERTVTYLDSTDTATVVYDATNLSSKRRITLIKQVKQRAKNRVNFVCLFIATPFEICLGRNRNRERKVPEEVIEKMYRQIQFPFYFEGWDDITIVLDHKDYFIDEEGLLDAAKAVSHDNPNHSLSIGEHCEKAFNLSLLRNNPVLSYVAKVHDLGKIKTKIFINSKGVKTDIAHYYGHECVGTYDALFYKGLKNYSSLDMKDILFLIQYHMMPYSFRKSEKAEEKWRKIFGEKRYQMLLDFHKIDQEAH